MKNFKRQILNLQRLYRVTISIVAMWSFLFNTAFTDIALAAIRPKPASLRVLALKERGSETKKIPLSALRRDLDALQERVFEYNERERNWHRLVKLMATVLEYAESGKVATLRKRGIMKDSKIDATLARLRSPELRRQSIDYNMLLGIITEAGRQTDFLDTVRRFPKSRVGTDDGQILSLVPIEAIITYLDVLQTEMAVRSPDVSAWHRTLKLIAASLETKRRKAVRILKRRGAMGDEEISKTYARLNDFADKDFDPGGLIEIIRAADRLDDYLPVVNGLARLIPKRAISAVRTAGASLLVDARPFGDKMGIELQLLLTAI